MKKIYQLLILRGLERCKTVCVIVVKCRQPLPTAKIAFVGGSG